ncbi:transcriptional regulator [Thermanaerovibrio velox DSM 12556]|uniref:Transcriptional regulator n=1 Tax=Thermanaerovibrio velox DSM 12556 TaxID=926567 RepID=H0UQB8_9BACT|nr:GntR family transcriptional regulator [Thermanaerovibrio velox]EHM10756.1 transcriptional regulator [Thermanaerovibrio velox DSM 12556]MCX7828716.1 GntR family transcriptional regulator [Thermanaerothrix sp.]
MTDLKELKELAERREGDLAAPYLIASVLREAIYRGMLPEGHQLHQAQLALMMGVSPIPLREALRILESEGLVAFRGHKGAYVTSLSVEEARELYEMVCQLETHLLNLAFPRITRSVLEEAEGVLDRMERVEDCIAWRDLNERFHNLLYEPAERPLIMSVLARFRQNTDRNIRMHLASMREESERQHRRLLQLIAEGDQEGAVEALRRHLEYTSNDLQTCMRRHGRSALPQRR